MDRGSAESTAGVGLVQFNWMNLTSTTPAFGHPSSAEEGRLRCFLFLESSDYFLPF